MAGYYSTRLATGTHDDLHAKAMVLESGRDQGGSCRLRSDLTTAVRHRRNAAASPTAKTGIPQANIMINATHSHTGPLMMGGGARDQAYGGSLPAARQYLKDLPGKIAESIVLGGRRTRTRHCLRRQGS